MTSVIYKRSIRAVTKNAECWPPYSVNCKNFKEIIRFYLIIGKKNNQSSVSDADRETETLGSTDNAGNSVNLVSSIIR